MLKWVQSGISAVAGTAEPEYGPEAIHPVTNIAKGESIYRETESTDFSWLGPNYTNVETQTFYFTCLKTGYVGFAQVIHSNVMGIHTTAQFTFRFYNYKNSNDESKNIWTSTHLEDFEIKGSNFYAKDLSIELIDNNQYILKSSVNDNSIVELTVSRLTPGVIFGKNGQTFYGEDIENPWGSMRHAFWPRCTVVGTIKNGDGEIFEIEGYTMFVMALQGMKPHHAAKAWNFLNFQSDKYSAVQMEFTTPRSYANTKVNIGIVCSQDKILCASINNEVIHKDSTIDEVGWPVPKSIIFNHDETEPTKFHAEVTGDLNNLVERVDVMAEIPQFVKNIVSGVAGTKPYIYQYCEDFEISVDGEEKNHGIGYCEVTFISEFD